MVPGRDQIRIIGAQLHGVGSVPDRIVAGTLMIAAPPPVRSILKMYSGHLKRLRQTA